MVDTRIEQTFNPQLSEPLQRKDASFERKSNRGRLKSQRVEAYGMEAKTASEEEKDLFPHIPRTRSLTESDAEKIDFDTPSFRSSLKPDSSKASVTLGGHSKQSESTSIWSRYWPFGSKESEKTSLVEEASPVALSPLIDYQKRTKSNEKTKDELSHLPAQGGLLLARLVAMSLDAQEESQKGQLASFFETQKNLQRVKREQFESAIEEVKNRKEMEKWSHYLDYLEYFSMLSGLAGGIALIASSPAHGGVLAGPGAKMVAGNALALTAKLAGKYFHDQKYSAILTWSGTLIAGLSSGSSLLSSSKQLIINQPKLAQFKSCLSIVDLASQMVGKASEAILSREGNRVQSNQYKINARNVTLQHKREMNDLETKNIIGGLKASRESTELISAASRALRTESEIKSQIALGNKY